MAILAPAYELSVFLHEKGEAATKHVLDHEFFAARKRALSSTKIELIALQLTTKPTLRSEYSACSDYANVLRRARELGIVCDGFGAWAATTTVAECVAHFRKSQVQTVSVANAAGSVNNSPAPANEDIGRHNIVDQREVAALAVSPDQSTSEIAETVTVTLTVSAATGRQLWSGTANILDGGIVLELEGTDISAALRLLLAAI